MDFTNHPESHRSSYELNSKVMLIAVFSLCFVILIVIILHIYARYALRHPRRRPSTVIYRHYLHPPDNPNPGLDPLLINSLPSFLFKQSDSPDDQTECAVCLSVLEEGGMARQLPNCNHIFHVECIDKWLSSHATCPICRSDPTPRLNPLPREPPRGGGDHRLEVVVLVTSESDQNEVPRKVDVNGSTSASSSSSLSSSSFRLSSFKKMISGRDRSSSPRRIQVNNVERDLD